MWRKISRVRLLMDSDQLVEVLPDARLDPVFLHHFQSSRCLLTRLSDVSVEELVGVKLAFTLHQTQAEAADPLSSPYFTDHRPSSTRLWSESQQ